MYTVSELFIQNFCVSIRMRRSVRSSVEESMGLFLYSSHRAEGFILSPLPFFIGERMDGRNQWLVLL